MLGQHASDKTILQKVNQRLARTGTGGQCHVVTTIRSGDVTLAGTLQYEMQRVALLRAAGGVAGVRRVIDQLRIGQKKSQW